MTPTVPPSTVRRLRPLGIVALLGAWLIAAHASFPALAQTAPSASPELRAVEAYVDAFNARDAEAMRALMHEDIEWLSIDGDAVETVSSGRDALSEEMRGYFESGTDVTSTLSDISQTGPYVSTVETARWGGADGTENAQASIAVYEISDTGLIRRVWYFPAAESG